MKDEIQFLAERQKRLFFDVAATPNQSAPAPKLAQDRSKDWEELFEKTGLEVKDIAVYGNNKVGIVFHNGLVLEDKGNQVSFLAAKDKESVKPEAVLPTIRCVANHLMRRGWNNMSWDIGTNAAGSAEMIQAFSKAAKEATNMLFWEKHGKDNPKRPDR